MLRPPQPSKRALTGVLLLYAVLTIVQVVVPALAFKSPDAVAGLLKRGLQTLRDLMPDCE